MKMKIGLSEGRRIVFDLAPLAVTITRAFERLLDSRKRIGRMAMSMSALVDCIIYGRLSWHWLSGWSVLDAGRTVVYGLAHWLGFILLDLKAAVIDYRKRIVIYSERLHVRLLLLADRAKASADVFRDASPRHQDRGSGDAVSHNDNKEWLKYILRLRQPAQHIDYHCYRRSSNAGRRDLGPLRRINDPLLQ